MDKDLFAKIAAIVGREHCSTSVEDLHCYSYDGSKQCFLPEAVAMPDSTAQVSALLKLANHYEFPVVARGAGSGMTGGALPIAGGLVIACSRLNRILEIDPDNQIAIVQPGVITGEFQQTLKKYKLFYPPDPASLKFCTLGGNAAECAGGPSAIKYGVTKDSIIGLEVVLAGGDILTTGTRTEKGVVGYDLTRLFIGSEGTLGIITKIVTRLQPLPEWKETFLLQSTSLQKTTELVAKILQNNILPCTLEYLDRTALRIVSHLLPQTPGEDIQAMLIIEIDGSRDHVRDMADRLQILTRKESHCTLKQATSEGDIKEIWLARRSISPACFKLSPTKTSEDVVVPRTRIPDLVHFCEALSQRLELTILTFGHAGDGNIHVNIMTGNGAPREITNATEAKKELFEEVIRLGGTLSGEHGVGITKSSYLSLELDATTLGVMRSIKKLFDPKNILNPGKIFPDATKNNNSHFSRKSH
ncbi:MAG: FAD-binding protein [Proteobacteria bacterium]|nr:FAD-binding protein [Pseudomonadota bacterium]MBU1057181.1 FAD-binding protein [Pseudomonadota bacterium]